MTTPLRSLALEFADGQLRVLDQRRLPQEERWETVRDPAHMIELIHSLAIRGAPLIGVSAALALAQFALKERPSAKRTRVIAEQLRNARPTAVNLAWAIERMLAENAGCEPDGLLRTAGAIFAEDVAMCEAMAGHGAELIQDGEGILTICNTGGLATVGIGTALGVIRRAHEQGKRIHIYACETRPLLQGARLTAWELGRLGIPHTLICDSMAAGLMRAGRIQRCFVGADRIAANGDLANKIGTYSLAVLAKHHGIPFYGVAPGSTVDERCRDGAGIPIEQRDQAEVRGASGAFGTVAWAPADCPTDNPAFDVTPAALLTGIVLDTGVRTEFKPAHAAHDQRSLRAFLAARPELSRRLGGRPEAWTVSEIGDGNVNLIFRVGGPAGEVLVKQALPYLRCVGEGWPLSLARIGYEHRAFREHRAHAPEYMPEIYDFDEATASLAMEFLGGQRVMRKGLIAGVQYPLFAEQIADYLARVVFATSDLALSAERKKRLMADFAGNTDLCKITEDLIFTDPYRGCEQNRWTSPQLDAHARALREDPALKLAIAELKRRFMGAPEALIHGDLHSGSIMVDRDSTKVIDPEFAFMGPVGFDLGLLLGNLLMSYFSQTGLATAPDDRRAYREWILGQIRRIWRAFAVNIRELARDARGDLLPERLYGGDSASAAAVVERELERWRDDAWGFAGAEMIRRIVGLAHVEDFAAIADQELRGECEARALTLARELLLDRATLGDIDAILDRARELDAVKPQRRAASASGRSR